MGQFGSSLRRKDESTRESEAPVVPAKQPKILSSMGMHQLLSNSIPEVFLVREAKSSEYVDEDGDVANEFYTEESEGSQRRLKRTTHNLKPQKAEQYRIPRLHPDLPVVIVQVKR